MTVNVYHKHSVVKEKAPDAKQVELGEIAVNANQDSPALYIKDSADQIRKVGGDITYIENELIRLNFVLDQIQDITDIIDNLDGEGLKKILKALAALEAQIVLLAQHNVDQDETIQLLVEADIDINKRIDNLTEHVNQQIEDLLKLIKALEAQVLLSAKHNADQDKHLTNIDKALHLHEQDINDIVRKIQELTDRVNAINVLGTKDEIKVIETATDQFEVSIADKFKQRVVDLEGIKFEAGNGIIIKSQPGKYQYRINIDKDWLDARIQDAIDLALVPYAKQDIETNTEVYPKP
jgi:hypothetical protein